jgi:large subunit ribosomal protein L17
MRHNVSGYKLGRTSSHRKAMWRNMAIALFTHGQITTSIPKAKSVKPLVEKLITMAKKGDLASRRQVIKVLGNPILVDRDLKESSRKELAADNYRVNKYHELKDGPRVVKKLFDEIAPRYSERAGGYTRIIKLSRYRIGDGTQLCVLQLISDQEEGPQVSGQFSRRRDKANKRMEFAAKLRKARGKKDDAADTEASEEASEAPETEVAAVEPDAQASTGEAESKEGDG